MVREILTYPKNKEILTSKSEEVKDGEDITELIQDMRDTLHSTEHGIGISAVQIGVLKRVCVIYYNGQDRILINPVITEKRGEVISKEGCLSVPEKYGEFKRFGKVTVEFTDENGRHKEVSIGGLFSRIVQHEFDHLEGWCPVFDLAEKENN